MARSLALVIMTTAEAPIIRELSSIELADEMHEMNETEKTDFLQIQLSPPSNASTINELYKINKHITYEWNACFARISHACSVLPDFIAQNILYFDTSNPPFFSSLVSV